MLGLNVARGRLPGASTLYGLIAGSSTKLCMRCDRPTPVLPAMNAGTQPPLGVIETTQPSASAAWIDVVPTRNASSCVSCGSASLRGASGAARCAAASARAARDTDSSRLGTDTDRRAARTDRCCSQLICRETLARVLLRQQALDRLDRRHVRVAVVEVAIGERQVHRLIQRVNVARAVVAHRLADRRSRAGSASAASPGLAPSD